MSSLIKTPVLYLCPNAFLGGAERITLKLCQLHQQNEIFKVILLFLNNGPLVDHARKLGIKVYVLNFSFRLRHVWSLLKTISYVRKTVKREKIQIIHNVMPYAHIIGAIACLGLDVKKIWFQHGPVGGKLDKIASLLPVDRILFNSQYL
jgi:hypothetical protein